MNIPFIFTSGIIVVIIFLIGLIYTFKEFKTMQNNPENYRRDRSDDPKVIK
ncbi:MAG: hypothetical protein JJU37_11010 [Balneolaceae bacterium]|nr:hypothetical protein [Balneolaceae bacterium]